MTRGGVSESVQAGGAAESLLDDGGQSLGVERLDLAGDGWRLRGALFADADYAREETVPRGNIVVFTGIVGLATGVVNNSATTMDFEFVVCINLTTLPTPIQIGSSALYGGSIAGALLDGGGDGAATLANDSSMNPIYELRTDSAACNQATGDTASVDTLYDHPSSIQVASAFGGANLAEQFFGDPIPSAAAGPLTSTTFEMVVRFSVTPGDFGAITANGVMQVGGEAVVGGSGESALSPPDLTAAPVAEPELGLIAGGGGPPPQPLSTIGFAIGRSNTPGPPAGPDEHDFETTVPLVLPIPAPSKNGGTIVGSLTDTSPIAGSCTVDTVAGRPYYAAKLDDTTNFSLYPHESFHIVGSKFRSVVIPPMTFGTPIPSADGPDASTNMGLNLHFELTDSCLVSLLAIYVVPPCPPAVYDVDGNGLVEALTDGLLILRWLFGFTGDALVAGALGAGATRTDPAEIDGFLTCLAATMLDIDGDGLLGALTDGLLLLRFAFGFTGETLVAGALGGGCTRCTAQAVSDFMAQFIP